MSLPFLCRAAFLAAALASVAGAALAAPESAAPPPGAAATPDEMAQRAEEIRLRNAVRADPGNAALRLQLASVELKLHNYGAAEAAARVAAQNSAADADVAPVLAQALLGEGKFTDLTHILQAGNRPDKAESQVRYALGMAYLELGDLVPAEPLLRDALRLDGDALAPKIGLTRFLIARDDLAGAAKELAEAHAVAPADLDVMRLEAELAHGRGDDSAALSGFDAVLARDPDDLASLLHKANIHIGHGDYADAAADIALAIKLDPYSPVAVYLNALIAAKQGDPKRAMADMAHLSTNLIGFPAALYLQGVLRFVLGQYTEADRSFSQYLAIRPNEIAPRRYLAAVALHLGDPARAVALLETILYSNPRDHASLTLLATADLARGDEDEAVDLFVRASLAATAAAAPAPWHPQSSFEDLGDIEQIAGSDSDVMSPVNVLTDLRNGMVTRAAAEAEAMVQRAPRDPLARDWLGVVRLRQRNYAEAERIFTDLHKDDPGFIDPLRNLAQLYFATGDLAKAGETWERLLNQRGLDPQAFMGLAEIALKTGDTATAVARLQQAQRAAPTDPAPQLTLLDLYLARKDWANVKTAAHTLVALFPTKIDLVDRAARALVAAGDPAAAEVIYGLLIKPYAGSDAVLASYAALKLQMGDPAAARAVLLQAIAVAPQNATHIEALVKLDYDTKGPDAAFATAQSFAAKQPVAAAWLGADVLIRAKREKEAVQLLTRAMRDTPAAPLALRLAQRLADDGNRPAAVSLLESWLGDHPRDGALRLELAQLYAQGNDSRRAASAYETVLTEQPNNPIALDNLAWLYAKADDPRARELAERGYYLFPTPQSADTYGWIETKGGAAAAGLPFLREAAQGLPEDPTVQYHLAAALDATGGRAQARQILTRILAKQTAFDERDAAVRLLATLKQG